MLIVFNFIVIILEIIYYSLFTKFSKKDGSYINYFLLYCLTPFTNILFSNVLNLQFFDYIALNFIILAGMKYLIKVETNLFDLLMILSMMLLKIVIEGSCYNLLINFLNSNLVILIFEIIKIIIVLLLNYKLNFIYNKMLKLWKNNNFYIRYVTIILLMIYIIVSIMFIFI